MYTGASLTGFSGCDGIHAVNCEIPPNYLQMTIGALIYSCHIYAHCLCASLIFYTLGSLGLIVARMNR